MEYFANKGLRFVDLLATQTQYPLCFTPGKRIACYAGVTRVFLCFRVLRDLKCVARHAEQKTRLGTSSVSNAGPRCRRHVRPVGLRFVKVRNSAALAEQRCTGRSSLLTSRLHPRRLLFYPNPALSGV